MAARNDEQQEEIENEIQENDLVAFRDITTKDGWEEYQRSFQLRQFQKHSR